MVWFLRDSRLAIESDFFCQIHAIYSLRSREESPLRPRPAANHRAGKGHHRFLIWQARSSIRCRLNMDYIITSWYISFFHICLITITVFGAESHNLARPVPQKPMAACLGFCFSLNERLERRFSDFLDRGFHNGMMCEFTCYEFYERSFDDSWHYDLTWSICSFSICMLFGMSFVGVHQGTKWMVILAILQSRIPGRAASCWFGFVGYKSGICG